MVERRKDWREEGSKLGREIGEEMLIGEYVLNETTKGDKEREFTYIGARGSSVIDYIIVNEYG